MPRFPSAQGRLNHEPDPTLAVTKTCPKDGVHLCQPVENRPNLIIDVAVVLVEARDITLGVAPTAERNRCRGRQKPVTRKIEPTVANGKQTDGGEPLRQVVDDSSVYTVSPDRRRLRRRRQRPFVGSTGRV